VLRSRLLTRPVDCDRWMAGPVTTLPGDEGRWTVDRYEATFETPEGASAEEVWRRARELLLRYAMFPPRLLTAHVCTPDGRVAPGATVVQRVSVGPFLAFESAVRVMHVTDDVTETGLRVGYTISTVRGHVERGYERFTLEMDLLGTLRVTVEAASRPATPLAWLGYPVLRWAQRAYTRAMLRRVGRVVPSGA
jgi:uncharacterized protein (UPF0548 family)